MKRSLLLLLLALICSVRVNAATLIHQYDLDGDFIDSLGGEPLDVFNAQSSSFFGGEWTWVSSESWPNEDRDPGAGLVLEASLDNPENYSLAFRFKFNEVGRYSEREDGEGYIKIVSFLGDQDDNGLYFYDTKLNLFPFDELSDMEFMPGTYYDFLITRSSAGGGGVRVYVVSEGVQSLVYDLADPGGDTIPQDLNNGRYEFRLFMDDVDTEDEWTTGGSVSFVKAWDDAVSESEVGDAVKDLAQSVPVPALPFYPLLILAGMLGFLGVCSLRL